MTDKGSRFLLTFNNPTVESVQTWLETLHTKLGAVYTNGQLEQGKEGTPHIQAYITFKNPVRCS